MSDDDAIALRRQTPVLPTHPVGDVLELTTVN
jgi:hypothetical protein